MYATTPRVSIKKTPANLMHGGSFLLLQNKKTPARQVFRQESSADHGG